MKTLSEGALFDSVLAAAAREGYPGLVTYEGVTYRTIKVDTSYEFRQIGVAPAEISRKALVTEGATATVIDAVEVGEDEQVAVRVVVMGHKDNHADAIVASFVGGGLRAEGGNVEATGTVTVTALEDSSGTPAVTFTANTTDQTLEIKVAGIADETWNWTSQVEVLLRD